MHSSRSLQSPTIPLAVTAAAILACASTLAQAPRAEVRDKPDPGKVDFILVRETLGFDDAYGADSQGRDRIAGAGDCP